MTTSQNRLATTIRASLRRQAWWLSWMDRRLHAGSVRNARTALAAEQQRARERREALAAVHAVVLPDVPGPRADLTGEREVSSTR